MVAVCGTQRGQLARFVYAAVGYHHQCRLFGQDGQQRAARSTTRAQDEHALASQRGGQVVQHIAHQANAIKVIGYHGHAAGRAFKLNGVSGTHQLRTRAALRGVGKCIHLEWCGDVDTASGAGTGVIYKSVYGGCKTAQRCLDFAVDHVLRGGLRKQRVDGGRLALCNRVADNGVAVWMIHGMR